MEFVLLCNSLIKQKIRDEPNSTPRDEVCESQEKNLSPAEKNCDCLWLQVILQALSRFSTTENGSVQQTVGKNRKRVGKQERKCSIRLSNGCVTP